MEREGEKDRERERERERKRGIDRKRGRERYLFVCLVGWFLNVLVNY